MTLTLSPETEAQLVAVASQRGLSPEAALAQVLTEARTEFAETVAGVRRGMAEAAAGHWVALEEFEKDIDEQIRVGRERQ